MSTKPDKTEQVAVRLPSHLVRQVDAHAKYLRNTLGVNVSRTQAVKVLLTDALKNKGKK